MNSDKVKIIFRELLDGERDKIVYSTGYKLFDDMFLIFEEFGLKKTKEGIYTIIERV